MQARNAITTWVATIGQDATDGEGSIAFLAPESSRRSPWPPSRLAGLCPPALPMSQPMRLHRLAFRSAPLPDVPFNPATIPS